MNGSAVGGFAQGLAGGIGSTIIGKLGGDKLLSKGLGGLLK